MINSYASTSHGAAAGWKNSDPRSILPVSMDLMEDVRGNTGMTKLLSLASTYFALRRISSRVVSKAGGRPAGTGSITRLRGTAAPSAALV